MFPISCYIVRSLGQPPLPPPSLLHPPACTSDTRSTCNWVWFLPPICEFCCVDLHSIYYTVRLKLHACVIFAHQAILHMEDDVLREERLKELNSIVGSLSFPPSEHPKARLYPIGYGHKQGMHTHSHSHKHTYTSMNAVHVHSTCVYITTIIVRRHTQTYIDMHPQMYFHMQCYMLMNKYGML